MSQRVIDFWFNELEPRQWWIKDDLLDQQISERFLSLHEQARRCELFGWRQSAAGTLAEILLLDQFSRHIYRDRAMAFAQDPQALVLAQYAIEREVDKSLSTAQRSFLYLPFMHSESPVIQQESVRLYTELGDQSSLDFAHRHKDIIDRFGRYPHRNEILGRVSTPEELSFLRQPGSGF
ncbi:DUF924 family protein [Marinobacterium maritimum]|uniref:DUF924 family protein n=1 Tax=Marinobacterium maritimum TaxID=500162 RepID=A0ABN1I955_9GAMM